MDFRKYNSIENSYQQRFVEKSFYCLDGYDDFIVQEKIHGANLGFYVSKDGIKVAKRTGLILEDESFFNYKQVLKDNEIKLLELQMYLGGDIIVYGELFGGGVQKGIFYSEEQKFYAFDIFKNGGYLDIDTCNELFERFGFIYAKTLFRGTLEQCFGYDIKRNSILQQELNQDLPQFIDGENLMEGIVIRPNITKYTGGGERIIFKKKNDLFSEKKAPDKLQFDTSKFEEYEQYITLPRLQGLISKEGEISLKLDCSRYAGMLVSDIEQDAIKDGIELSKQAKKYLFQKCIKFILQELF